MSEPDESHPPDQALVAARAAARAEVERVRNERSIQVEKICREGLSTSDRAIVNRYVASLQEILGEAWAAFVSSSLEDQVLALHATSFLGMH